MQKNNTIHSFVATFFIVIGLFIFTPKIHAQSTISNNLINKINYSPLSTAVPFVLMSADPRTGGFGSAGISALPSPSSTFWSLAKTTRLEDKYVANINYTPLLPNLQIEKYALLTFTNTYKISGQSAVSVFGKYLNMPEYNITNYLGESLAKVTPLQFTIGAGYAFAITRNFSIGLAAKYIHSSLAPGYVPTDGSPPLNTAKAIALDFSLDYAKRIGDYKINYGLSISNLGNKVAYVTNGRYDFLPANLGLGVGFSGEFKENHKYHIGLDLNKILVPVRNSNDSAEVAKFYNQGVFSSWFNSFSDAKGGLSEELKEIYLNLGFEYTYKDFLSLRTGYIYQNPEKGNGSMITLGTSIKYTSFDFDFAYGIPLYSSNNANTSPLANSFRFGIVFHFNEK